MIEDHRSIFKISISDFLQMQEMQHIFNFLQNQENGKAKSIFKLTEIKDIRVKQVLNTVNNYALTICKEKYAQVLDVSFQKTTWIREPELVKWEPGSSLPPHIDGPGRIEPPQLTVGGLVYLNDNYSGGELYFPDQDVIIKPSAGDLVFFPCHFYHEVKVVGADGEYPYRYTLPLFYTFICEEIANV